MKFIGGIEIYQMLLCFALCGANVMVSGDGLSHRTVRTAYMYAKAEAIEMIH
jgi:hypothetical protein